jgi:hypothetical protein
MLSYENWLDVYHIYAQLGRTLHEGLTSTDWKRFKALEKAR